MNLRAARVATAVVSVPLGMSLTGACSNDPSPSARDSGAASTPVIFDSETFGLAVTLPKSQAGLYTFTADDKEPRKINNDGGIVDWSPDGSRIAYVDGDPPQIWTMNPDGTDKRELTDFDDAAEFPAWSHDGTRIAFIRGRWSDDFPDAVELYIMNADGSGQQRVTDNDVAEVKPTWSPDGSEVAVMMVEPSGRSQIAVVDIDSGSETDITPDIVPDGWIDWSRQEDRLVFTSSLSGKSVWTMKVDGSDLTELRPQAGGLQPRQPVWSPNGEQIAFLTRRNQQTGSLWVMSADGSEVEKVLDEPWHILILDWIPDRVE